MKNTGVFLTKEELEEMTNLSESARILSGNDFAFLAHKRMFARLAALTKIHGLPEISEEYGLTNEGEFVSV